MAKELFELGENPRLVVEYCAGDLIVRPWLKAVAKATGDYTASEKDGVLTIVAQDDLILHIPEQTNLHIAEVGGDAIFRSLAGDLSIDSVGGDLVLSNLAAAKIGNCGGDVVAANISGPLSLHKITGDLAARNLDDTVALGLVQGDAAANHITGALTIDRIEGDISIQSAAASIHIVKGCRDVNLQNVAGECRLESIDGDIRLSGGLGPYQHEMTAEGDIVVSWPVDQPLLLEAAAPRIDNRLPLEDVVEKEGVLNGRLGDGKTRLVLNAGGRIVLKEAEIISKRWTMGSEAEMDFDFLSELSDLGAKISSEVGEQVARVTAELESNLGPAFMQRMSEQFAQKAASAAQRTQEAADKARRSSQAAQSKAGGVSSSQANSRSGSGDESQPKGATYEAQLKILKMVEQGTISPDEASMLLEALQGD